MRCILLARTACQSLCSRDLCLARWRLNLRGQGYTHGCCRDARNSDTVLWYIVIVLRIYILPTAVNSTMYTPTVYCRYIFSKAGWSFGVRVVSCKAYSLFLNYITRAVARKCSGAELLKSFKPTPEIIVRLCLIYCNIFFTARWPNYSSFTSIKHLREMPTGSRHAGALNTGGV